MAVTLAPRKFTSGHFAFMRAVVQGIDLRASWDRYLRTEGEHEDLRKVRSTIARMRERVRGGGAAACAAGDGAADPGRGGRGPGSAGAAEPGGVRGGARARGSSRKASSRRRSSRPTGRAPTSSEGRGAPA